MVEPTDAALKLGIAARAIEEAKKFLEDASHMIGTARNEPLDILNDERLLVGAEAFHDSKIARPGSDLVTHLRAAIEAMIRDAAS